MRPLAAQRLGEDCRLRASSKLRDLSLGKPSADARLAVAAHGATSRVEGHEPDDGQPEDYERTGHADDVREDAHQNRRPRRVMREITLVISTAPATAIMAYNSAPSGAM